MEIIAHRGYGHKPLPGCRESLYLENTFPALAAAVMRGFPVEFDVRVTRDGEAVVCHDDVLENDDFTLSIKDTNLADLQKAGLVAKSSGDRLAVPVLQTLLFHIWGRVPLHVELKSAGSARAVIEVIRDMNLPPAELDKWVVVSSFILGELVEFRSKFSSVPAFWLREGWQLATDDELLEALAVNHLQGVHLDRSLATPEIVSWFTKNGYIVRVFTVNDPTIVAELFHRGVSGIFTDQPDAMLAAVRRLTGA